MVNESSYDFASCRDSIRHFPIELNILQESGLLLLFHPTDIFIKPRLLGNL